MLPTSIYILIAYESPAARARFKHIYQYDYIIIIDTKEKSFSLLVAKSQKRNKLLKVHASLERATLSQNLQKQKGFQVEIALVSMRAADVQIMNERISRAISSACQNLFLVRERFRNKKNQPSDGKKRRVTNPEINIREGYKRYPGYISLLSEELHNYKTY